MTTTPGSAVLSMLGDSDQTVSSDAEDIRGRAVLDSDGTEIGTVEDLLVDEREHRVRFMLVTHGGFLHLGRKTSLIPVDDITGIGVRDVRINHARNHVGDGPGYDPELVNDHVYLSAVYDHYDLTPYWGVGYGYPVYPYYPGSR